MRTLRCSVALCAFNGERYLAAQVESLFRQQRLPDEIVAVDDASTDGSFLLLQELAARSPVPMRVHRNESNLGYVRNFERAMSLADGDVLFLCDQDDVWMPEKVRVCMAHFETDERVALVHSDAALVDADLSPRAATLFSALGVSAVERKLEDEGRGFELLLKRNIVTGATAAVRRDVLLKAVPFPPEWVHDEWLALVASLIGRLVRIETPLVQYRQHGANQIGVPRRALVLKLRVLFDGRNHQRRVHARAHRAHMRLLELGAAVDQAALARAEKTVAHSAVRAALPPARWKRVPAVLREVANFGYFRYSRGWISVARDLFGAIEAESR